MFMFTVNKNTKTKFRYWTYWTYYTSPNSINSDNSRITVPKSMYTPYNISYLTEALCRLCDSELKPDDKAARYWCARFLTRRTSGCCRGWGPPRAAPAVGGTAARSPRWSHPSSRCQCGGRSSPCHPSWGSSQVGTETTTTTHSELSGWCTCVSGAGLVNKCVQAWHGHWQHSKQACSKMAKALSGCWHAHYLRIHCMAGVWTNSRQFPMLACFE